MSPRGGILGTLYPRFWLFADPLNVIAAVFSGWTKISRDVKQSRPALE